MTSAHGNERWSGLSAQVSWVPVTIPSYRPLCLFAASMMSEWIWKSRAGRKERNQGREN